nr:B328 [uncultured bacterium]
MSGFDDREKGFEAKFRLDQESQFKVTARRNKLLGLWAAAQLGKTGADAEAYARDVVAADFTRVGDSDVIEKVVSDLKARNIPVTDAEVRAQLDKLARTAREQILAESNKS